MHALPQTHLDLYRERMEEQDKPAIDRLAARANIDPDRLSDALWVERMRLMELQDPNLESVR